MAKFKINEYTVGINNNGRKRLPVTLTLEDYDGTSEGYASVDMSMEQLQTLVDGFKAFINNRYSLKKEKQ